MGAGAWTRTIGFYKTHPDVTESILGASGGIVVCGLPITNVAVDNAESAIEAMCVSPMGDSRVQLARQLTAAGLTMAAGGATFADFAACNAVCADPGASTMALADCVDATDDFNMSGDQLPAPFDPPPMADPGPCTIAHSTPCTFLDPSSCSGP